MSTTILAPSATPGRSYGSFENKAKTAWFLALSDSLRIISDEIVNALTVARTVSVSDSLRIISDRFYPPPIEATHFTGAVSDALQSIIDAIGFTEYGDRNIAVSDTLQAITEIIKAARINLENPVYWQNGVQVPAKWVAPLTITPRVTDINNLHLAAHPVLHPGRYYEPRVKSYGTFTRAISAPVGFVKTGDVSIGLVDPDNSIRQRLAAKTIRKATAELRLGPEGGSLIAFLRPLKREVGTVSQPSDGVLRVPMRDYVYDLLENSIPAELDTDRYPNLPESPARDFSPIIIGSVSAAEGAIPLFLVDGVGFGYLVARHPCKSIDAVYRKRADEDEFSLVSSSEYTIDNVWQQHCIINFTVDQADAEIRANVTGYYDQDTGALKCINFADFILEVLETIMGTEGLDRINFSSFEETHDRTEADGLACSGVLFNRMTFGELISQIQRSSNVDIFSDKNDRITAHYTTDDEEPTVSLDDVLRLYKGTVRQSLADPAYNQIKYRYGQNYATGKWTEDVWDNVADQAIMGEAVPDEELQLFWIRDAATALAVVERRGQYLDLDSFRFEGEIPLVPVLEELELGDLVEISHFGGIKEGGYTEEQFKILELSMDIDNLKYAFKGIRRRLPPPTLKEATLAGTYAINSRVGPHSNGVDGRLYAIFRGMSGSYNRLRAWYTDDYGETWSEVDAANAPVLANNIASFDSFLSANVIHVATQEASTGRVAYHIFSMATKAWTTVNEQVLASCSNGSDHCVSIECRYPDGEPVIFFQGDKVLKEGQYWHRGYHTIKQSGTWSIPVVVTPDPGEYSENTMYSPIYHMSAWAVSSHCYIERVVAGRENRMHFFYQIDPAVAWVQWSPDEYAVTMKEDLTLSGRQWMHMTGTYYPTHRNIGGVVVFDDRSKIAVVHKAGYGEAEISVYGEGPGLIGLRHDHPGEAIYSSTAGTDNPAGFLGVNETEEEVRLYLCLAAWGASPQIQERESTDAGENWTDALKASPTISYPSYTPYALCGNFLKIRGKMYMGYFADSFLAGTTWRWQKVESLPYAG